MIVGIEHVSMATDDVPGLLRLLGALGMRETYREELSAEGVRSVQLTSGTACLEVLDPLRDDAPVRRFVTSRGAGLHHVCFEVDDLAATVAALRSAGLQLVSPEPREDGQGRRVFVHPRSAHGVLMGFVQRHARGRA